MTDSGFTVQGADRLAASMKKAAADLADLGAVNTRVAQSVAPAASGRAPRRTGALAASVRGTGTKKEARVESALIYGPVIHYGWAAHNIDPHPFITEAIDTNTDGVVSTYENAVSDQIGQIRGV